MSVAPTIFPPCVVLAGNSWGSVLGVVRSLGSRGVRVYVLAVDRDPSIYAASRYCYRAEKIYSGDNSTDFCVKLLKWGEKENFTERPILFPLTDNTCTYIAENRLLVEKHFNPCLSSNETIINMLDKEKADTVARKNGLALPLTAVIKSDSDINKIADNFNYPVIIKPTWWKCQGHINIKTITCTNKYIFVEKVNELVNSGATLLAQEYIEGGDDCIEVYMFYRSKDGKTTIGCAGKKIRQIPQGAGIMASGQSMRLPHVEDMSKRFLDDIDFRGLGGIEFKRSNDKSYFIEMSVRPEGFHPLSIQSGLDLPWYAYSDLAFNEIPAVPGHIDRGFWVVGSAYIEEILLGKEKFAAFKEIAALVMKQNVCFAVWKMNDPKPWLLATHDMAKSLMCGLKKRIFGKAGSVNASR